MSQTRLNAYLRTQIVNALIAHKLGERKAKNGADACQFNLDVFHSLYTKKEHALLATSPDGFFKKANSCNGQINGTWKNLLFGLDAEGNYITLRSPYLGRTFNIVGSDALGIRYEEIKAETDKLNEETNLASRTAHATVNGVTTVEALLKAWPEVAPFIPAKAQPVSTALVVQTDKLNALFGLPADVKENAFAALAPPSPLLSFSMVRMASARPRSPAKHPLRYLCNSRMARACWTFLRLAS
jgi:hypothetical protein